MAVPNGGDPALDVHYLQCAVDRQPFQTPRTGFLPACQSFSETLPELPLHFDPHSIQSIDKRRNKFKVVRVALFFLEYVLKHHGQNSVVSSGELPQSPISNIMSMRPCSPASTSTPTRPRRKSPSTAISDRLKNKRAKIAPWPCRSRPFPCPESARLRARGCPGVLSAMSRGDREVRRYQWEGLESWHTRTSSSSLTTRPNAARGSTSHRDSRSGMRRTSSG